MSSCFSLCSVWYGHVVLVIALRWSSSFSFCSTVYLVGAASTSSGVDWIFGITFVIVILWHLFSIGKAITLCCVAIRTTLLVITLLIWLVRNWFIFWLFIKFNFYLLVFISLLIIFDFGDGPHRCCFVNLYLFCNEVIVAFRCFQLECSLLVYIQ